MLMYLTQDNGNDGKQTLIDIYGKQLLDIDWKDYYKYVLYTPDEIDPHDVPMKYYNDLKHQCDLNPKDMLLLYVVVNIDEASLPPYRLEYDLLIPDHMHGYVYSFFFRTEEDNGVNLEVTNQNYITKKIGDKETVIPKGGAYNIISTHSKFPGTDEFRDASKLLSSDHNNHGLIVPSEYQNSLDANS